MPSDRTLIYFPLARAACTPSGMLGIQGLRPPGWAATSGGAGHSVPSDGVSIGGRTGPLLRTDGTMDESPTDTNSGTSTDWKACASARWTRISPPLTTSNPGPPVPLADYFGHTIAAQCGESFPGGTHD